MGRDLRSPEAPTVCFRGNYATWAQGWFLENWKPQLRAPEIPLKTCLRGLRVG